MKNVIYIDIDTEREQPILIGKGQETVLPTTREEAAKMILEDIACVCDALISLIHVADQNEYGVKETLTEQVKNQIAEYLKNPTKNNNEKSE
jgi:hypothetical protein